MHHTLQSPDKQFWKKLIDIGLPISLQAMLFSLLGVVDIFMVSQLGESATAAVGVGNRIFFFNLIVISGTSGAVSVLASQYFGANDLSGIKRTLAQTWAVALLITIPFVALYTLFPEAIVSVVASEPEYIRLASEYLWITGISLVLTAVVVPMESALRAVGQAKMPTNVSIIAIIINVVLNGLLIFGIFGFPELGVVGAAIGTTLSRLAQTFMLFYMVNKRYSHLFPTKQSWRDSLQTAHRHRFSKVATPMIVHDTAWAGGLVIYSIIVGQLGISELAIISLLSPIESVLISAFLGFAVAASIILGNEIGAKNYQRVSDTAWWYVISSCVLAMLLAGLCMLAEPFIYNLLSRSPLTDPGLAVDVCLVMAFGMILKVFNMVGIGGVLKSGGDIKYSIFIDLFGQWAIGIPLAYFTGIVLGWPLHYVMMAILLEEVIKIFLTAQRIQSKKWVNNLIEEPAASPI